MTAFQPGIERPESNSYDWDCPCSSNLYVYAVCAIPFSYKFNSILFLCCANHLEPQRKSTRNFECIHDGIPRLLVNKLVIARLEWANAVMFVCNLLHITNEQQQQIWNKMLIRFFPRSFEVESRRLYCCFCNWWIIIFMVFKRNYRNGK